jgi:hypothetical protein
MQTKEFFNRFENCHGSTNCMELLNGLSLNDPDDFKKIKDQNLFEIRCEKYIVDAVNLVEKL